ncbi:MAG: hypothetical protein KTR31_26810 [Myxococcales bacterium]|nr:hypothetical protein [Myxococcales bacterium]
MYIGRRYPLPATLGWSRSNIIWPMAWAASVTAVHELTPVSLGMPWLPISAIAVAVAFYLGFKNSASYDRTWEARKIWGAIVNASRSWAYSARDLVHAVHLPEDTQIQPEELVQVREQLVLRHVAWLDALRHQLRKVQTWEHQGGRIRRWRKAAEYEEDLSEVLGRCLPEEEVVDVVSKINPAAHLISNQSRQLAELREWGVIDGFAHIELQVLLKELMTQQGKAERIKNFPFPRQYATVNSIFAWLFTLMLPFGMIPEFAGLGPQMVWLTVPFATVVAWVFLTTDQIGDWSENPFEGLANDVPITAMARGIERDVRELVGQSDLPPPREPSGKILM